jgi:hypothetical protein
MEFETLPLIIIAKNFFFFWLSILLPLLLQHYLFTSLLQTPLFLFSNVLEARYPPFLCCTFFPVSTLSIVMFCIVVIESVFFFKA